MNDGKCPSNQQCGSGGSYPRIDCIGGSNPVSDTSDNANQPCYCPYNTWLYYYQPTERTDNFQNGFWYGNVECSCDSYGEVGFLCLACPAGKQQQDCADRRKTIAGNTDGICEACGSGEGSMEVPPRNCFRTKLFLNGVVYNR